MALRRHFLILLVCDFLTTLTPLGWCHPGSVFAVRGKHTVESCQVHSGFGHQGRKLGDEVHRLEDDVGGAIPIRGFQLIPNLALPRQGQAFL